MADPPTPVRRHTNQPAFESGRLSPLATSGRWLSSSAIASSDNMDQHKQTTSFARASTSGHTISHAHSPNASGLERIPKTATSSILCKSTSGHPVPHCQQPESGETRPLLYLRPMNTLIGKHKQCLISQRHRTMLMVWMEEEEGRRLDWSKGGR